MFSNISGPGCWKYGISLSISLILVACSGKSLVLKVLELLADYCNSIPASNYSNMSTKSIVLARSLESSVDKIPMKMRLNASNTSEYFSLLNLPIEVRFLIYDFVFTIDPETTLSHKDHPPHRHQERQLPCLNILLTCSQIYHEARVFSLRVNSFDFYRWYSSNVFECRQFLNKLLPWQVVEIRRLQLAITEADLKQSDSQDILYGIYQSVGPYLEELQIDIGVAFDPGFDWYTTAANWISKFESLKNLRSLRITLGRRVLVTAEDVSTLHSSISQILPRCQKLNIRSLKIEHEKKATEQISGGIEYLQIHQTVIAVPSISV